MNFKYYKGKHFTCCFYKHGDFVIWKRMCTISHKIEHLISWGINSDNSFFLQDKWLGNDSLDNLLSTSSCSSEKVNNFLLRMVGT